MERFINSINKSLKNENWYSALGLALTVPDICGKIENPTKGSRARFVGWYNQYILESYTREIGPDQEKYIFLSGDDCYSLRCAYLHEGKSDIENQRARDILNDFEFIAPPKWGSMHCNSIGNGSTMKLQLQVDIFCKDITNGIQRWYEENYHKYEEELNKLLTISIL